MDLSFFKSSPLWKKGCLFGKMLIRLEGEQATWQLGRKAHDLLKALTLALLAEQMTAGQENLARALEICREIEASLNDFFAGQADLRIQLRIFFRLEELREMLFLEMQENRALCCA